MTSNAAKTHQETHNPGMVMDEPKVIGQGDIVLMTLQTALTNGVDADSLEKILAMQERILDRQAEQSYSQAMVEVQQNMPVITPNKENPQTHSKYADMGEIIKKITPIYTAAGFALSFAEGTPALEGEIRVTCDVMHSQGHAKHYFVDMPLVTTGLSGNRNMTETHGTGSAFTYGQRYLTKLVFNLNVGDDDDGNTAGGDTRTALDVDNFWFDRMLKLKVLHKSISRIKTALEDYEIEAGGLEPAIEAWYELTKDEQEVLWRPAPTQGGILTTREREIIKSNEWAEVRNGMSAEVPEEKE